MKRKYGMLALVILVLIISACGQKGESAQTGTSVPSPSTASAPAEDTYPNAQLLVDVAWVEERATDPNVVILDTRAEEYGKGHIPGAVSFPSGNLKDAKNNSIVPAETATELLQNAGINSDTTVVLYDEGNALSAARVFYVLEYFGLLDQVKVLNGGYAAWVSEGKDVSTEPAQAAAKGNFIAVPNENLITTKEQLMQLDIQQCTVVDARSEDEYTGKDLRNNQKGGHIPGAVNVEWNSAINTETEDGVPKFKSYAELKTMFKQAGIEEGKTIIPYCQTNVRGAHTYFTLRLLGYTDIRPYEGSWAEWGNSDDTEVVS